MPHIPIRRNAALILVASLAVVMVPGLVLAHADLVTPTPADTSSATEPVTEVAGIYSEAMTPSGSSLIVKDASGTTVAQGTVDSAKDTRMVATPTAPLGTGSYSVDWTSVATDGHVERGKWSFTVAVATAPSSTPLTSVAPSAVATRTPVAAAPSPSSGTTPSPSAGGGTAGSSSTDVVLPIIVALIVLGAGAAYLLSRRNRPPDRT